MVENVEINENNAKEYEKLIVRLEVAQIIQMIKDLNSRSEDIKKEALEFFKNKPVFLTKTANALYTNIAQQCIQAVDDGTIVELVSRLKVIGSGAQKTNNTNKNL